MFVGTVPKYASKAFIWIPDNLLTAKMHAYGFSRESLTFF